jgi:hypothetical protein
LEITVIPFCVQAKTARRWRGSGERERESIN